MRTGDGRLPRTANPGGFFRWRAAAPLAVALILVMTAALLAGCGPGEPEANEAVPGGAMNAADEPAPNDGVTTEEEEKVAETKPVVEITMQDGGKIDIELDPSAAPITVANFLKLVNDGFYDGLTFHRIIPGFMIQGGDPEGTGMGGASETIKGEFSSNGVDNSISHERGVISMARSQDPDSASSQFFITNADSTFLDGQYAAFGTVISGMDVVDKISGVETTGTPNDAPLTPVVIESIKQIQ
jgi:peptidyl-prolyl cis-trans isomerase B (cyclophilin B)